MGDLRPTQRDEKRFLFSNFSLWKHQLSPCHPDRSVPSGPFLEMFFDRRGYGSSAHLRR
jgi:hypothetical protein